MTIAEAAERVLRELGRPASSREILEEIQRRKLFEFKARDPFGVVSAALRRKSDGSKSAAGPALFVRFDRQRYAIADEAVMKQKR